jgi:hypothetical protein
MNLRAIISRRIRTSGGGVRAVGDVNAVVSANVGERGSVSSASSRQETAKRSPGGRKR